MGLTGEPLLEYLKGVPEGTPPDDIIRGAGYSFTRHNGQDRQDVMLRTAFFQAVAEAKGEELACLAPHKGTTELVVSTTGRVTVPAAAVRWINCAPGEKVHITQSSHEGARYLTVTKAP